MSAEVDYKKFMNGYRDPITRAEERERMRADSALSDFARAMSGGNSGSGERECGYREEGGTYAEVPSSPNGKPLEHFLTCVPVPIDKDEYRLHPKGLGVSLVDLPETCLTCGGGGQTVLTAPGTRETPAQSLAPCSVCGGVGLVPVTHIFDVVGTNNYPNVADFIEESRRRGVSRRLELEAKEYGRLTSRSRLIMLHRRAIIFNPDGYYLEAGDLELQRMSRAGCPKNHPQHKIETMGGLPYILPRQDESAASTLYVPGVSETTPAPLPGCAALWWHDIEQGERIHEQAQDCSGVGDGCGQDVEVAGRFVERKLKSGAYRGYSRPSGVIPQYALGIFAIFPLVKITVIDPEGKYEDRVARARNAGVDVDVQEY